MIRRPKFECRTCGRGFGSLEAFDAHLGSDSALDRGIAARLRGEPSQEGHSGPRPIKGRIWMQDEAGTWRRADERYTPTADGLLAGLAGTTETRDRAQDTHLDEEAS